MYPKKNLIVFLQGPKTGKTSKIKSKDRVKMLLTNVKVRCLLNSGMGNFRINPDFRTENFHFKHEISLLHLFTRPSFCVKSSYLG